MRIKSEDKKQPLDPPLDSNGEFDALMESRQKRRYGSKCDPAALDAIRALHSFLVEPRHALPIKKHRLQAQFWNYVAQNYLASWQSNDGSLFRKLADAMDVARQPNNPAWNFVLSQAVVCDAEKFPAVTTD